MIPLKKRPAIFVAWAKRFYIPRSLWFSLSLVLGFIHSLWGLDPHRHLSQYGHTAWRMQDGVFGGTPNVIAQTTDGYLWIGTMSGVLRFDGVRFIAATTSKGEPLPSVKITSLLGASDGSLWIGTPGGLRHLKNGELFSYSNQPSGISAIIQDHTGAVWVSRYRVTDGKGPLCRAEDKELQCYGKADGIPVNYGVGLAEDSEGKLWLGSFVLCQWRPGFSRTFFAEELKHFKSDPAVLDIVPGPSGSVWAALERIGPKLGVVQLTDGKWRSYSVPGFDGSTIQAHNLLFDRENALWVGTTNHGLYRIHDGDVDHYQSADGLSGDSIYGLYQDREGNLWVATDGGVDVFRDTAAVNYSIREGLSTAATHSVLASRDGSVWVGNEGALDVLRNGKISSVRAHHGLPGDQISALFEDHNGRLWLGVDKKLMIYEQGLFHEVTGLNGSSLGTEGEVAAITEDVERNIWALTYGQTRHLFRITGDRVQEEIPLEQLSFSMWLEADKEAGIWIGTYSNRLGRYRNRHLEVIPLDRSDPSFLMSSLLVDSPNSIWIATTDGLFRWKDGQSKALGASNGLPCVSIFSLIKDNEGSFWLYTQCGLLKVAGPEIERWWERPDSKVSVQIFDAFDAVHPGRAPAQPKISKSPDGRLWIANGTVLQMIDPAHLYRNSTSPPVHIEDVVADHKSYRPQDHLYLPALINDLEIDYTALSYTVPQKVHFRYQLEGHDAGWEDSGTRRQAFYSNLAPGKYHFRVIACNNDGIWNEEGATLDFSIAPAWYQTNWFLGLCVVAAIFFVWAPYHLRVRQIAKGISDTFDERLAERTRMARELHDTFLQTIQGSKMVVDDALEQPTDDPVRMRRVMERLSEWLEQATQEGRAALNSLRTSTTQRNDLAEAFQRATENDLIPRSMAVGFSVIGEAREMHPIVRDEIYRVGYEAIHNACLHSGASRVAVELKYANDLMIRVSDNGVGIDPGIAEKGKEGHFGLQGMRERAGRIGGKLTLASSAASGTEVTLIVPGNIVFRKTKGSRRSRLARIRDFLRSARPPDSN